MPSPYQNPAMLQPPGYGGGYAPPPAGYSAAQAGGMIPGLSAAMAASPQTAASPAAAAAPGTVGSYTAGQQGGDPQGIGMPPESFFESPRNAALRYLQGKGLNPYSPAIGVQALLNRAQDVIASVLGRALNGGGAQGLLSDPQAGLAAVNAAFDAAMQNAPGVLMGRGEAQSALGKANDIINGVVHSGSTAPSEGDSMLAALLGDPSRLANLATSMLYGTMGSRAQNVLSAPYQDIPFWITEYAGNRLGQYDPNATALGLLLSGRFPRINVGTPGQ